MSESSYNLTSDVSQAIDYTALSCISYPVTSDKLYSVINPDGQADGVSIRRDQHRQAGPGYRVGGEEQAGSLVNKVTSPPPTVQIQKAFQAQIQTQVQAQVQTLSQTQVQETTSTPNSLLISRFLGSGESHLVMESEMFAMGDKDNEVIKGIIGAVPVNMMDDLAFGKGVTEMGFHDSSGDLLSVSVRDVGLGGAVHLVALWGTVMKGLMFVLGSCGFKGVGTAGAFDGEAFSSGCVNAVMLDELGDAGAGNAEYVPYFLAGKVSGKVQFFKEFFRNFFVGGALADRVDVGSDFLEGLVPSGTVFFHGRLLCV